jgi:hypothetical protein
VITVVGDITAASTATTIINHFSGALADLVVCDGAPDVTGIHDMDIFMQSHLLLSALDITVTILRPGGTFVAKIFRDSDMTRLYNQTRCLFTEVDIVKPASSRDTSLEAFIVCRGMIRTFHPDSIRTTGIFVKYQPASNMDDDVKEEDDEEERKNANPLEKKLLDYVVFGDLSSYNHSLRAEGDNQIIDSDDEV